MKDPWLVRFNSNENAKFRIFCFHHAGGAASSFQPWSRYFSKNVDLVAIQLPGRWDRFKEPFLKRISDIVAGAEKSLSSELDLPFAVIGFSMGALIGFEWIQLLREKQKPLPCHFFPISRSAPDVPPGLPSLHDQDDQRFLELMNKFYGGVPAAVIQDPEMRDLVLPCMKSDMEAFETYHYVARPPLPVFITALSGDSDPRVASENLRRWSTQSTCAFIYKQFKGGHFFQTGNEAQVVDFICNQLGENLP